MKTDYRETSEGTNKGREVQREIRGRQAERGKDTQKTDKRRHERVF